MELLHLSSEAGPTFAVTLALVATKMNPRIRRDGLAALLTGEQLPLADLQLILSQKSSLKLNHLPSAKSKPRGRSTAISVGDLVFLKGDKGKIKVCDKYLVIAINENLMGQLQKFATSQFDGNVTPCLCGYVTACAPPFLLNLLRVPFLVTLSPPKTTLMINQTPATPLRDKKNTGINWS